MDSFCRVCQALRAPEVREVEMPQILDIWSGPRWTAELREKLRALDRAVLDVEVWTVEGLVDVAWEVAGDARLLPEQRRMLEDLITQVDGYLLVPMMPSPVSQMLEAVIRAAKTSDNTTAADRLEMDQFLRGLVFEMQSFDLMDETEFVVQMAVQECVASPRGGVHVRAPPEMVLLCRKLAQLDVLYPGLMSGAWKNLQ